MIWVGLMVGLGYAVGGAGGGRRQGDLALTACTSASGSIVVVFALPVRTSLSRNPASYSATISCA